MMTLIELAKLTDQDLILVYSNSFEKWIASIKCIGVRYSTTVHYPHGTGLTPEEALIDYTKEISDETIEYYDGEYTHQLNLGTITYKE